MLSADVIDDMLNRLSGRRTMTVKEALRRCADELEAELNARYANTLDYPSMKRKYDLDMQTVIDARAALAAAEKDESELVAALEYVAARQDGVSSGTLFDQFADVREVALKALTKHATKAEG